jgi:hypothetical protein
VTSRRPFAASHASLANDLTAAITAAAHGRLAVARREAQALAQHGDADAWILLASMWRQLGAPDRAAIDDAHALTAATTIDHECEARVGLLADAVARGDLQADPLPPSLRDAASARVRIRFDWVAAERALLHDDPTTARQHAERARQMAIEFGSTRHLAKSALIHGVATGGVAGAAEVRDCAITAATHHWRPLLWAAAVALGWQPGGDRWLAWAHVVAGSIAERCDDEQRAVWAANPAVRAVHTRVALGTE